MGGAKVWIIAGAGTLIGAVLAGVVLAHDLHPDFLPMWAALRVPDPYNVAAVTDLIRPYAPDLKPDQSWAYPYPPTFLLLTTPFGWLPFGAAFVAWCALSAGALSASARSWFGPVLLVTPATLLGLLAGQTSLIVGALAFATFQLRARPWLAGVLLGLAACIKPQYILLAPVALIPMRAWRLMLSTALTGAVLCAAVTLWRGFAIWPAWLTEIGQMFGYWATISPHLDLSSPTAKGAALLVGGPLLWLAGQRQDAASATCVLFALGLLIMPNSLWYGEAMAAPAALVLMLRWRVSAIPAFLFLAGMASSVMVVGLLLAVALEMLWPMPLASLDGRRPVLGSGT